MAGVAGKIKENRPRWCMMGTCGKNDKRRDSHEGKDNRVGWIGSEIGGEKVREAVGKRF